MDECINFWKDEITQYFKKSSISKVYEDFYPISHNLDDISATEVDSMRKICYAIRKQLGSTLTEKKKDITYLEDSFYPGLIESPEYEKAIHKIRTQLGENIANPYLEEYETIARLRRTLVVTLVWIYGTSIQNIPKRMKTLLHQDYKKVIAKDFFAFIDWLKKHPNKNIIDINDILKNDIERLYTRIMDIDKLYLEHKEVKDLVDHKTNFWEPTGEIIPVDQYRKELIRYLNERFKPSQ